MWSRAKDAKDLLNLQDLPYPPFGIFSSGPVINSNAVASTMLRVMGISEPSLGWALVPGAGNLILSPPQISDIQMRRPIPSGGGVSNSGNSNQFTWDWSYDGYTSVLVDSGFVAHSWYGDGDVVDTRLLPSTFDVWSMADFNPTAQHELSFSQILPSTYVSSNGYGIEVDFFLVNQVADDVLDEIGSDLGISGLRGAVSVQIDLVNGDVWRTDFSFTTSNPQSPLAQRLAELNQPKGMDDYQRWFQERAESITRDVVEHYGGQFDPSESGEIHRNDVVVVPREHRFQPNPGSRYETTGIEASIMNADLPKLGRITSGKGAFDDVELTLDSTASLHDRQSQVLVNAMATFQLDGAMETMPHMRSLPWQRNEQYLVSAQ